MLLSVRDVAQFLHVSENTVQKWAVESGLPGMRIAGRYCFNRTELLEWVTIHQIGIDAEVFRLGDGEPNELAQLTDALECGCVRKIAAAEKPAMLAEIAAAFGDLSIAGRDELQQLYSARGPSAWTILNQSFAIPHPRYPIVAPIAKPQLQVCYLDQKISVGNGGQAAIDTLFVLLSPTVRTHLTVIAGLGGALADKQFVDAVRRRASIDVLLSEAKRFESGSGRTASHV